MQYNTLLLAGKRYEGLFDFKNTIYIPDNPYVDFRLAGHADLSLFYAKGGKLFCSSHLKSLNFLEKPEFISEIQGEKYPKDVLFNARSVGEYVFLNEKYISDEILLYLKKAGKRIVNVNQGYSACGTLAVDDNSIITSDAGIYSAAVSSGIRALKISPGFFELAGFDYGFIGGSAFPVENKIAFTGKIDSHPDKGIIKEFIISCGKDIVFLSNRNAFDIGAVTVPSFFFQ